PYMALGNLEVVWGDLNDYDTVFKCVEKSDLILHVAAFVSPQADYNPQKAMQVNYGSTKNLITAIKEQGRENEVKFVYIGTVAEPGDRM
ncbi:NAD-dependent epimerase/dehydratase family protein, partial [Ruminococcus sp.]|uniref:NAD-dependent epimerase/dehydratase family protein n=1 Tax=Ruminococcus sp. TaxID=41978 RepID=UPI003FD7FF71